MVCKQDRLVIFAVNNGYLDDVEVGGIQKWEEAFYSFMDAQHPDLLERIKGEKKLTDVSEADLKQAIEAFKALR